MWVEPSQDPRETGVKVDQERSALVEYLRAYRLTLEMKCADLDPGQLARRSVPPSSMSLLGLVRHMAEVERYWFRRVMAGERVSEARGTPGEGAWEGARPDPEVVARAWEDWRREVEFSERLVSETEDLARTGRTRDGAELQLREVLLHLVEEYARHCGHADLLRERIDGRVGQ